MSPRSGSGLTLQRLISHFSGDYLELDPPRWPSPELPALAPMLLRLAAQRRGSEAVG